MPTTLPYPEHQIFLALCDHLTKRGFVLESVEDEAARLKVSTPAEAETLITDLDEATLWLEHPATPGRRYVIFLVPGNGTELVSDYSYPPVEKDPQGWSQSMDEFLDWITATFPE